MFGLCRASVCDSGLKGRFPVAQGAALGDRGPQKGCFLGLKGRFQGACCFRVRARVFRVLTHLPLLKPAVQAWWVVWGVSEPGAYAPGFAEIGPSGLVRVSAAWRRFRSVVCASGHCICWFGLPAAAIQA